MKSRRYQYLDLLKVIAIFFVCMYHFWHGSRQEAYGPAGFLQTYFHSVLSTCVPLFFAVNGALMLNRETFDAGKHYKKLLVLFLQYGIWHGITAVILGISAGLDFSAMHKHQLLNIFLFLETPEDVDLNHFWFIMTLFGMYLLYPFVRAFFEREQQSRDARISLLVLWAVTYLLYFFVHDFAVFKTVSPYLMQLNMDGFQSFGPFGVRMGTMLLYFLAGGALHRYRQKTGKVPAAVCVLMILSGLLLSYGIVTLMAWQGVEHYDIVFEGYNTTGTLLCTVGIFLLASRAEEKLPEKGAFLSVIQCIGRNTMTVYYTHWILGSVLLPVLPIGYGFFWNLLKSGLLVICGTLLGEGMRRIPVVKYLVH